MISESQARKYCKENISRIENYDKAIADKTKIWDCHHRTEIWWNCSVKELIENECYYDRKACELIFLTHEEHIRIHMMYVSDERRKKLSDANKDKTGEKNPFFGKHHSYEARKKISESTKGENHPFFGKHHTEKARKKMSDAHKGKPGFWKGKQRSDDTRKKISEALKCKSRRGDN